jgi:hypothetical protein
VDRVPGGLGKPADELTAPAWLFGLAAAFGALALAPFIARDPPR